MYPYVICSSLDFAPLVFGIARMTLTPSMGSPVPATVTMPAIFPVVPAITNSVGKSNQGAIRAGVTGKQLEWLKGVLKQNKDAAHKIVMGHAPCLGPVRKWSSSGLMVVGGRKSAFWQTMAAYGVDVYLCGEVHAITCTERDGVQQIAHGGLIGYNTRTNYMVVDVYDDRLELTIKEIDMVPSGKKLWQPHNNRPLEKVDIILGSPGVKAGILATFIAPIGVPHLRYSLAIKRLHVRVIGICLDAREHINLVVIVAELIAGVIHHDAARERVGERSRIRGRVDGVFAALLNDAARLFGASADDH